MRKKLRERGSPPHPARRLPVASLHFPLLKHTIQPGFSVIFKERHRQYHPFSRQGNARTQCTHPLQTSPDPVSRIDDCAGLKIWNRATEMGDGDIKWKY
jgi:hypothetical protein